MSIYNISLHGMPGEQVTLSRKRYGNGRMALQLFTLDLEPYAMATVNLPEIAMAPTEIAVKDYSENEGMLQFLIDNNIVEPPHRFASSGFVVVPICSLKGTTCTTE